MQFLKFFDFKAAATYLSLLSQAQPGLKENTILVEPTEPPKDPLLQNQLQNSSVSSPNSSFPLPLGHVGKELTGDLNMLQLQQQLFLQNMIKLNDGLNSVGSPQQPQIESTNAQNFSLAKEKEPETDIHVAMRKKIKKKNKCGHDDKTHYAKGMCNNCYHKYGRTKKPWNCPHDKLYAAGMCQNCYINNYNRKKRQEKGDDDKSISRDEDLALHQK